MGNTVASGVVNTSQQSTQNVAAAAIGNPSNASMPQTGSIGSSTDMALKTGGGRGSSTNGNTTADYTQGIIDQNQSVQSAAGQSVSEHDDLATMTTKLKAVKRENQQLRNLLRQNEHIINTNIELLKQERSVSLRLC